MAIKFEIITSAFAGFGEKRYKAELAKNFFTGKRFRIKIEGHWKYVVAYYNHHQKLEPIKKYLYGGDFRKLIGLKVYYHDEFLDSNYIGQCNKYLDTVKKFKKKYEDKENNIESMALKELGLNHGFIDHKNSIIIKEIREIEK